VDVRTYVVKGNKKWVKNIIHIKLGRKHTVILKVQDIKRNRYIVYCTEFYLQILIANSGVKYSYLSRPNLIDD